MASPQFKSFQAAAYNYAHDSDNKIHDDDVAQKYGFRGGLVPGVAHYAYLSKPLVDAYGRDWLERGVATVRFDAPIYEGDPVCTTVRDTQPTVRLELENGDGAPCSHLLALLPDDANTERILELTPGFESPPKSADPTNLEQGYAAALLPPTNERPPAGVVSLPAGKPLGSLKLPALLDASAARELEQRYRAPSTLYQGANALRPAAFVLDMANEILASNVLLGPWIHASSRVRHWQASRFDEPLELRGRVASSWQRKGNEWVELDLALFGQDGSPRASVSHTAIIKLGQP